jgi:hypothetical protein
MADDPASKKPPRDLAEVLLEVARIRAEADREEPLSPWRNAGWLLLLVAVLALLPLLFAEPCARPAEAQGLRPPDPRDELRKRAYDVKPAGTLLFAAMEIGLVSFDAADPARLVRLGELEVPGSAVAVTLRGPQAWIAAGPVGLVVADVSDPRRLRAIGALDTPGAVHGVALSGDTAWLADGTMGLAVVDVADPTRPAEIGRVETGDTARDVAIDGTVLWTAEGRDGVRAFDVSDARRPRALGTVAFPTGDARRLAVAGGRVFVAAGAAGVAEIGLVDGRPTRISLLKTGDLARGVAPLGERHLVVADGIAGITVVDVSDAARPRTVVRAREAEGSANRVAVLGSRAYVAHDYAGVAVYDLSNPSGPRLLTGKGTGR